MRTRKNLILIITLILFVPILIEIALAIPEVAQSAEEICPLLPGSKLPEVTLEKLVGSPLNLSEEVKRKPTILIFYRGGW